MITICDNCPCLSEGDTTPVCGNGATVKENAVFNRKGAIYYEAAISTIPLWSCYSRDCQLHEIKYSDKVFKPERREE